MNLQPLKIASAHQTPLAIKRYTPICRSESIGAFCGNISPKMLYRKLGNSGLDVSVLGFGSWVSFHYQLELEEAKQIIKLCYDQGVNFFDSAEVYAHGHSERILGQAFKELDIPRCNIVVSTKLFFGDHPGASLNSRGLSRKHIVEGLRGESSPVMRVYWGSSIPYVTFLDKHHIHRRFLKWPF